MSAPSTCETCQEYARLLAEEFSRDDMIAYNALKADLTDHQAAAHPNWAGTVDDMPGNAFSWRGRMF